MTVIIFFRHDQPLSVKRIDNITKQSIEDGILYVRIDMNRTESHLINTISHFQVIP